jgi:hypothetical protein
MRWLAIWLLLAQAGWAETIAVSSGNHDGYARLVFPLPAGAVWQVGRTEAGYELAITGDDLRFDLSRVFDLIPKDRLTGVFVDPGTGRLQLALSCACHALAYQFDARTLVIDLRDGVAPAGSSFELSLEGSMVEPLVAAAPARPKPRPDKTAAVGAEYNWLAVDVIPTGGQLPVGPVKPRVDAPLRDRQPDLQPLRDTLLRQLSRGAADGVIDLAMPKDAADLGPLTGELGQVRVTKLPGLVVQADRPPVDALQPDGAACLPDMTLDLAAWAGEGDVATQIATARGALVGEFDRPDQTAVSRDVRLHLYLGFGAEAALTMKAFDATDADVPVWQSLARVLDERPQTANAFANMGSCDTAAAMWALLAAPVDALPVDANIAAVQRAFSALPPHLRLQLGPMLADRALAMGQMELARSVADAARRTSDTPVGPQALVQAKVDLAAGNFSDVVIAMDALLAQGGSSAPEALILLVEARVALAEPVGPDIPGVAAAMLRENAGGALEPKLHRAWVLAMADAGDFDGSFAAAPAAVGLPEIWGLLARNGRDADVLTHAVVPPAGHAALATDVPAVMAKRLLTLGFADAAAAWLRIGAPAADPLLAARIDLARGDGRAVLQHLAGAEGAEALAVKATAEEQLGQHDLARLTWALAGDSAASVRAAGWAQNWRDVTAGGQGAWQATAAAVTRAGSPTRAESIGPLAMGHDLVSDSAAVRADIDALLLAVPKP